MWNILSWYSEWAYEARKNKGSKGTRAVVSTPSCIPVRLGTRAEAGGWRLAGSPLQVKDSFIVRVSRWPESPIGLGFQFHFSCSKFASSLLYMGLLGHCCKAHLSVFLNDFHENRLEHGFFHPRAPTGDNLSYMKPRRQDLDLWPES